MSITPGQIDIHDRNRILEFILAETEKQINAMLNSSWGATSCEATILDDESEFKLSPENDMSLSAFLSSRSRWLIERFNETKWPQGFVVSLGIDYAAHVIINYIEA